MTRNLAAVLTIAASIAHGAIPASADTAHATTFDGHCQFAHGTFTYAHPVGFLPTQVNWTLDETGTCSGRVNGQALAASPARVYENVHDDIGGCGPLSDAHGPGLLAFASGARLSYYVRHGIGLGQPFLARGTKSGLATGVAEAFTENKPSALQQCASGSFRSGALRYLLLTLGALRG
jgi:hypothetical protein